MVQTTKARTVTAPNPSNPPQPFPGSTDVVGEMLHCLRMDGVVYALSHLSAPWGVELPPMPECVMFHVVTSGRLLLTVEGEEPCILQPGDFALVPHGQGHGLADDHGRVLEPFFDLPVKRVSPRYETLTYGGGGAITTLICGAVRFDHLAARDLIAMLPSVIHIETWSNPHAEWMHSTLRLMATEAQAKRPGGETIVTRLADIMVIQAIRMWLGEHAPVCGGWIGALRDERIGNAIREIHRAPEREWSVASLAETASMSRSAFSARFTKLVGESPMNYLTRWRMNLVGTWLCEQGVSLAVCADRLGYQSEAAFSRAFKRVMGVSPGGWKRARNE